jgi:uncharacterized protein YndB with AHSA1/START domain
MTTVISEITVNVPVKQAYRAFTNATALREWMCDLATVAPRPSGRIYLWWNGDFYSAGHYLALEENQSVKFTWLSNLDPGPSEIEVTFTAGQTGTQVRMAHRVPEGDDWARIAQGFKAEWDSTLENLKSVLETGIDQRIARRPMLGILPGDFTPEQAAHLGVPVKDGFRLDGVVDGMGAQNAGLQKDDVIVEIDGKPVGNDFTTFLRAIGGKKGGDGVSVTFYRGAHKQSVQMELSKRPMPEVPFDPAELASRCKPKYEAALEAMEACFEGVTDAQARFRPSPEEWSALDTLAHLLQGERANPYYFADLVGGYERWSDDFGGNVDAQIRATVNTYPTVQAMLSALRQSCAETLDMVANLPTEFAANKGSFYRVGQVILQGDYHFYSHIPQIRAAIEAAA